MPDETGTTIYKCANCKRPIGQGKEQWHQDKPYGKKCFLMVTGEIPNSRVHSDAGQEAIPTNENN